MTDPWTNPDDAALAALLRGARTIAVVGASPDPGRPSHGVMAYLLAQGYRVVPVRPGGGEVLGVPVAASLEEATARVGRLDLVDVFRAPAHVPAVVDEAVAAQARALWLQDGVVHPDAAARARAAGLVVVMDRCTLRDHARLVAGRP